MVKYKSTYADALTRGADLIRIINETNYDTEGLRQLILIAAGKDTSHKYKWRVKYCSLSPGAKQELRALAVRAGHGERMMAYPCVKLLRVGDRESLEKTISIVRPSSMEGDDVEAFASLANNLMPPYVIQQVAVRVRMAVQYQGREAPSYYQMRDVIHAIAEMDTLRDLQVLYADREKHGGKANRIAAEKRREEAITSYLHLIGVVASDCSSARYNHGQHVIYTRRAEEQLAVAQTHSAKFEAGLLAVAQARDILLNEIGGDMPDLSVRYAEGFGLENPKEATLVTIETEEDRDE